MGADTPDKKRICVFASPVYDVFYNYDWVRKLYEAMNAFFTDKNSSKATEGYV